MGQNNSSCSLSIITPALTWACFTLLAPSTAVADGGVASPPQRLEEMVVESAPLEDPMEAASQHVTVISGSDLTVGAQNTLGETLASQPGIAASSFGAGASRPIIRGLGGDRIRILENGIGTQDASNVSPDHAVTIEPSTLSKIEVTRGPAALLYGTSAIGGVVNVFDNRIPEELPSGRADGNAQIRGGTVDKERNGSFNVTTSAGPVALHADGFKRKTSDYTIPGFAHSEDLRRTSPKTDEPRGTLPSSSTDSDNVTLGTSLIRENGFIGAAVSQYSTTYGVPNGEPDVSIDAHRNRADFRGKLYAPASEIKSLDLKLGIVDYDHTEYEGSTPGTVIRNNGIDSRFELAHNPLGPVEGIVGLQFQRSDFEAVGDEAFQPPTVTDIGSGFLFEEYKISPTLALQGASRFDRTSVDGDPSIALGPNGRNEYFSTVSSSLGSVWKPADGYSVTLTISRSERAPTGQELFAEGPHVATGAYERGDLDLRPERSWGYDLSARKETGRITGSTGVYYNRFSNYIGLYPTDEVLDDFTVYEFRAARADLIGFESQFALHLLDPARSTDTSENTHDLTFDIQPDYIYAVNRDTNDPLPRIPPARIKTGITYSRPEAIRARLEVQQVFHQTRNASEETETPHYTFLNLYITKPIVINTQKFDLFVRGLNLLNEKARDHTSFIKDVAPLPGANVVGGIEWKF